MGGKKLAVYVALGANVGIAGAKFVAFAMTGSSAILAEGLHSVADSGNEGLLLLGRRMARNPADRLHPFGHGMELYFWSMVVALSIFVLGGMASLLEGIYHVWRPEELGSATWSYVTLGIAAVFEGSSLVYSYRQLQKERVGKRSLLETVRDLKDPTVFMLVFEDAAALAGLLVAFLGVLLSHVLKMPRLDGAGAVGVGLILMGVAVYLVSEVRKLLVGERAMPEVEREIRELVKREEGVVRVAELKTMQVGAETVVVAMKAEFRAELRGREVAEVIGRMEGEIRRRRGEVK
ncbi:MAG: cation diffusion facilitator family transporter [Phycisphaerae bacterium]